MIGAGAHRQRSRPTGACSLLAWAFALGLAGSIAGCAGDSDFAPGVAARLDGQDVLYQDFEDYVENATGEASSRLDSAVLSALFDQFLEQELLLRLAVDRRLLAADASPSEVARRLLQDRPAETPTDQELAAYYREHSAEFERGDRVLLRQVLAQDPATAESIRSELDRGTPFDELANRFVGDERAVFVSERGELQRSQLPAAFVEPIFALEAGETSAVLEADYGFHVFQVVAKRAAGVLPLAEVEDTLRRRLEREKATRRLEQLVAEARARYNLQVAERNLPFEPSASAEATSGVPRDSWSDQEQSP